MWAAVGQNLCKICCAVLAGLVRAEVQADRDRPALALGKAGGDGLGPLIVEPEAVDRGAVLGQSEQARFRVAGLWQGCCRADLDEAEARAGQRGKGGGVLVVARGQADGVQKRHPGERGVQPGKINRAGKRRQARAQRQKRKRMRMFGIDAVQKSQARAFQKAHSRPSGKMWPVAPSGRDLSQTTSSSRSAR